MRWSPSVTVAAVIRRNDRYLMVEERPDGTAVINQPAGHVEFGESPADAVVREVLEETGRNFKPDGLVGIYQWTVPDSQRTYLRFCFRGQVGEPIAGQALDPAILATHWLTRDEIMRGPRPVRSPLVLRGIDDAGDAPPMSSTLVQVVE